MYSGIKLTHWVTVIFVIVLISVLALAFKIRSGDIGYIKYISGDQGAAISGLKARAAAGDSYAALLLGRVYGSGSNRSPAKTRQADHGLAADWYLKSARLGELVAVRLFLNERVIIAHGSAVGGGPKGAISPGLCDKITRLLNQAAAAGDAGAGIKLGGMYRDGDFCVPPNKVKAAQYYLAASKVDPRLTSFIDKYLIKYPNINRAGLSSPFPGGDARPTKSAVLKAFISDAPSLFEQ